MIFTRRLHPRRAFTMTEILIVIALIVLLLAIAVPAFNAIRGGRSVDSAENQVAAMLGRARAEAIGKQKPYGIMFFLDREVSSSGNPEDGRLNIALVREAPFPPGGTRDVYLEIVPDTDYLPLPDGVLAFTLADPAAGGGRYRGFATGYYYPIGGVVLFNGEGQLVSRSYGFATQDATTPANPTRMQRLIFAPPPAGPAPASLPLFINAPAPIVTSPTATSLGFALCDRENFKNGADQQGQDGWLDDNSSQLIINRYNGTLTQAD